MFSFRNGVYKSLSHIMLIEIPQTSASKFFWWLICIINSVDNTKLLQFPTVSTSGIVTAHLSQSCNPLADGKERGQKFSFKNGVHLNTNLLNLFSYSIYITQEKLWKLLGATHVQSQENLSCQCRYMYILNGLAHTLQKRLSKQIIVILYFLSCRCLISN